MTHRDAEKYSKKHVSATASNEELASKLKKLSKGETLTCAAAFQVVREMGIEPAEAGKTLDLLDIKLVRCQMGLFGYPHGKAIPPRTTISPALKAAILDNVVENRLSCARAWQIAEELNLQKTEVSAGADFLGIKIKPCQLGAF